jgi:hypothetical protein
LVLLQRKAILGGLMLLLSLALGVVSLASVTAAYGPEKTCYPSCINLKIHAYDAKAYVFISGAIHFVTLNASAYVTDQYGNPVKGALVYVVVDGTTRCSSFTNKYGRNNASAADCTVAVGIGYHYWYLSASLPGYTSGKTPTYSFNV